jgi:hypothetical protein
VCCGAISRRHHYFEGRVGIPVVRENTHALTIHVVKERRKYIIPLALPRRHEIGMLLLNEWNLRTP